MKSRVKLVIILAVVLVLIAGGVIALGIVNAQKQKAADEKAAEEEAKKNMLLFGDYTYKDVTGIKYTYKGEELEFVLKDGEWTYPADPEMPFDDTKIDAFLNNMDKFKADNVYDASEIDLTEYGLDKGVPFTITMSDGEQFIGSCGNYNTDVIRYYILIGDKFYMCSVDMEQYLRHSIGDYVKMDQRLAVSTDKILSVTGIQDGKMQFMVQYTSDLAELYYTDRIEYFEISNGVRPLSSDGAADFIKSASEIMRDTVVTYKPTAEEKTKYGLDNPYQLVIQYLEEVTGDDTDSSNTEKQYAKRMVSYYLGDSYKETDNSGNDIVYYYAMMDGSDMIYTIREMYVDFAFNTDWKAICEPYLMTLSYNDISKLVVTQNGVAHTIAIDRSGDEDVCTVDGREVSKTYVQSFVFDLIDVTSEKYYDGGTAGYRERMHVTITIDNDKYKGDLNVDIFDYNSSYCIGSTDKRMDDMLLNVRAVDGIENSLKDLLGRTG